MKKFLFGLCFVFSTVVLSAQLPTSNIFLFEFRMENDSMLIENAAFLTGFNAEGYNNQAYFSNENSLLITSNYLQKDQTDIFQLDLRRHNILQITDTDQSEYSPTPTPDGENLSVIRVEPKHENAQYLWRYPQNRKDGGFYYFKDITNIGYHCWLDEDRVALFLVNDPYHQLALGNIKTGKLDILIDNIGRTLTKNSNGNLLFVHKISSQFWYIKSFDPKTASYDIVCRTLDGREDFAILSEGSLLMADGSKLFQNSTKYNTGWQEVCDFSNFGLFNITRIKVLGNKLCVVNVTEN